MNSDIAISVRNVSKTFKIPHEKISSLRGAAISVFKKKSYEEFKALDDVSFEVKKGEFFGIIGRNGSGKSTLLKVLAGIYQADKGKVEIDGLISPFLELGIGFNPELSGRDNVYLNATVLGMTQKQIDAKFNDIVAFSELERFIDQKLKNYSSGMQVRLAFSVAIHANREILLMDEVLAVGDTNFQSKCLEEFNRYRDLGKTIVLVTHDIGTVQKYCDRAMLLRNGKIIEIGEAENVINKYIHKNMSDEESRMAALEVKDKKDDIRQSPDKIAEITKVDFLDVNGEIKNVFSMGDNISARVYFKIHDKNKNLFNFGFGLYNLQNLYLFGISTIADKIDTGINLEKGYFQVNLKNVFLRGDSFYIKASIVGKNFNQALVYSHIEKSKVFKIVSTDVNEGITAIDYDWS